MKHHTPLRAHSPIKRKTPMRKRSRKTTPERQAACGMPCMLNVAGVCNYNVETTVLCHLRFLGGGGMGLKPSDAAGVFGCSACHDWLDGRTPHVLDGKEYELQRNFYAARALVRMREYERDAT